MQSLSTHTLSRLSPCVFHFDTYDKLSDPLFSPSLSMRESTRFCTWSRAKWNRKKLLPSILKSACFPPSIEPARRGKDYQFIIYNPFRCFPSTNAVVRGMTRKEGCSYANSSGRSGKSLSMSGRMEGRGVSSTGNRVEYRGNGRGAALNNSVTDWSGELGGSWGENIKESEISRLCSVERANVRGDEWVCLARGRFLLKGNYGRRWMRSGMEGGATTRWRFCLLIGNVSPFVRRRMRE